MSTAMNERPSLKALLKPRFRGALLGGAIGDALGFPYEGSSRSYMQALGDKLVEGYEKHRSGYFPAGQFSDDTQMTLATVEAIVAAEDVDGAAIAAAFVPLWRENRVVGREDDCTEAIQRLMDGTRDWSTAGEGGDGNGAAMRAAPIGLWDYDRQDLIVNHVRICGGITHKHSRALAGAAAVAAAVAYNVTHREIILGDFLDAVGAAAGAFDDEFARCIQDVPRLLSIDRGQARDQISVMGREDDPPDVREGIPATPIPTVLMAITSFLRSPSDYLPTVHRCLLAGGDADTCASIAGSLSGAMIGAEGLPEHLVEELPGRDGIIRLADALHGLREDLRAKSI